MREASGRGRDSSRPTTPFRPTQLEAFLYLVPAGPPRSGGPGTPAHRGGGAGPDGGRSERQSELLLQRPRAEARDHQAVPGRSPVSPASVTRQRPGRMPGELEAAADPRRAGRSRSTWRPALGLMAARADGRSGECPRERLDEIRMNIFYQNGHGHPYDGLVLERFDTRCSAPGSWAGTTRPSGGSSTPGLRGRGGSRPGAGGDPAAGGDLRGDGRTREGRRAVRASSWKCGVTRTRNCSRSCDEAQANLRAAAARRRRSRITSTSEARST